MKKFCLLDGIKINIAYPKKKPSLYGAIILMRKEDGTISIIDNNDTIDQAFLDRKINHPDKSKRWYPIEDLKL